VKKIYVYDLDFVLHILCLPVAHKPTSLFVPFYGTFCAFPCHSGGNDRFCARLKTDISAFSSGLQGHLRSCLIILDSSRRPLSKKAHKSFCQELQVKNCKSSIASQVLQVKNCKSRIASQELQVKNCKSRIASQELH
jgi:hypothetical protein